MTSRPEDQTPPVVEPTGSDADVFADLPSFDVVDGEILPRDDDDECR